MLKGKVYYISEDGREVFIMNVEALTAARQGHKSIDGKVSLADISNTALNLLTTNPLKNAGHSSVYRFQDAGHEIMQDEDFVLFEDERVKYIHRGHSWELERF